MTLRNEIFEGIGAYKGVKEALGDTARDRYYEALAAQNRIPVDEYNARKAAREKAIRAGRPATMMPTMQLPTAASTATPGTTTPTPPAPPTASAFLPAARSAQATPGILNFNYQQGGIVKKKFDPEGDGYDDETAEWEGVHPEMNAEDGKMHGMSRVPRTGLQLKGRKHPTWDKAIETDRRLGYGLEMRDGRYYTQKFADGGMVDDETEADLILRSLISRDIGVPQETAPPDFAEDRAAAKINREVGEPWTVTGPSSEYQTQGARDKLSNEKALGDTQAMDATRMQESAPVAQGRSRLQRATDWMRPDPAAAGQARRRRELRREINRNEPGLTEQLTDSELRQREEKGAELRGQIGQSHAYGAPELSVPELPSMPDMPKMAIDLGTFTPPMGPAAMMRPAPPGADTTAVARSEINETGGTPEMATPQGPYPVQPALQPPPAPTAPEQVPAPVPGPNTAGGQQPVRPPVSQQGDQPTGNTRQPNQTPAPVAVATNGAPVPASTNGPPNVTVSTPGGFPSTPAPPPGAAAANRPTNVRKALNDRTRTEAYDPVADLNDPGNVRPVDASGRSYSPGEIQQVLAGAATLAPQNPVQAMTQVGTGAVTRQNFNAYVQQHSNGGAFSPGEAMLVGMLSDYKMLLQQGHVDQANKMAFGLIQAASLEAASYGYVARDQFKAGNFQGALQSAVQGANYIPDGMTFKVGPDGRSIVAMDASGQVTGQQAVTPQQLIAMITGLGSGQMIWQALQTSASMLTKPDRNAEGRALSNQIKRNSILLQEQRLKKGAGGGRAVAGSSPAFQTITQRLASLGGGSPKQERASTTLVVQGDDTDPGAAVVAGERFDDDG